MRTKKRQRFELSELAWVIGYQLTAYIGSTTVRTVAEWLRSGLPKELEGRMKASLDVALPIAEIESELVAQGFLIEKLEGLGPYNYPATMLRDADDVCGASAVLVERAKKEFLDNEANDLEGIERRLKEWTARAKVTPRTKYTIHFWQDRLSLKLIHVGFPEEQQRRWDEGLEWPLWEELIAAVPEMAYSRISINLQTGSPFRYLRRAGTKPGRRFLNSSAKKEWLHRIQDGASATETALSEPAPHELIATQWMVGEKGQ